MHLALIILCAIVGTFAAPADFTTLNFIASAPYTYNHQVGGGARNDKTSGVYDDTVESLEGKQQTCGDLVSFMLTGTISRSPRDAENYLEVNVTFSATTTGQPGVAFSELVSYALHTETLMVENGDNGTGVNLGVGFFGIDGYVKGRLPGRTQSNMQVVSGLTGLLHSAGAYVWASARLGPLRANDQFVMRFDVRLVCLIPSNPTGNLQGKLDTARNIVGKQIQNIPGGTQTIPMKSLSGINGLNPCVIPPNTTLINASDFKANVTITGGTYSNSGATIHAFYYSWSKGGYSLSSTTTGTFNLHTFETTCNVFHGGEYLYSQSLCGCESTKIGNNQPQFFVSAIGDYYNLTSVVNETINGIPVRRWTSLGAPRTIAFLYLRANDSSIVRVNWTDGRVFTFSDVVYGPIPPSTLAEPAVPCTCRRRLDVAFVIQRSGDMAKDSMPYYQSFGALLVDSFTIGPENVQMSVLTMGDSTQEVLSLANGNTATNIKNTISSTAVSCPTSNNKQLTCLDSGVARYDIAITQAVASLKNSTRKGAAKPVIIVVTNNFGTAYTAQVVAAVASAESQGISVFVMLSQTSLTPSQYANLTAVPDNLVRRYTLIDLSVEDPIDLVSRVCLANAAPCGSTCCGACDSACGTCIPVDTCLNAPPATSCKVTNVLVGTCCQNTTLVDPCPTLLPSGSCSVSFCNATSNACSTINTCPAGGLNNDGNCYTYSCSAGQCVPTPKFPPSNRCWQYDCVNNNIVANRLTCPTSDACTVYTCNNNTGCQPSATTNPYPSTQCNITSCDTTTGWSSVLKCPPLADKCVQVTCNSSNGNCGYSTKQCRNATKGLCDRSGCNSTTGNCNYSEVVCPPQPCKTVDTVNFPLTGGCNPVTGQCVYKDKACSLPCHTCNTTTDSCPTTPCDCTCLNQNNCSTYTCDGNVCVPTPIDCEARRPDFCHTVSCSNATGCVFTPVTCNASSSPCVTVVRNASNPTCCSEVPKDCSSLAGPCTAVGCSAARGGCYADAQCLPNPNLCLTNTCNGTHCLTTERTCPQRQCFNSTCAPSTGLCDSVYLCDDGNNCTEDTCGLTGCVFTPKVCASADLCVSTSCDAASGLCLSSRKTCNDNLSCTVDSCNASSGECVFAPKDELCDGADPCLSVTCHAGLGCVGTNKTCAAENPDTYCLEQICFPFQGCSTTSHVCTNNDTIFPDGKKGSGNEKLDCLLISCSDAASSCVATQLDCTTNNIIGVVAGTISAGILAAIILGIALFVAVSGGATYAAFNKLGDDTDASINNNPLFNGPQTDFANPLHEAQH